MYYNHFYKEQFMTEVEQEDSNSTVANYISLFNKSKQLEEMFDKDLYNFDSSEIEMLLYSFNTPSRNTLNTYLNQCKRYADYAIGKGDRVSNINLFKTFSYDSLNQYVNVYKQKYITKAELDEILKDVYNVCDKALYLSIFDGIAGYQYSEISNITIDDLKKAEESRTEDGLYTLEVRGISKNTGELATRKLTVESELLKDLNRTYRTDVYYKNNGNSNAKAPEAIIVDGEYVFRNTQHAEDTGAKVDKQFVYRKLRMLKTISEDAISSVTTLMNSGILYHLSTLAKDGKISINEAKEVFERYDYKANSKHPNSNYRAFGRKHKDALLNLYGVEFVE